MINTIRKYLPSFYNDENCERYLWLLRNIDTLENTPWKSCTATHSPNNVQYTLRRFTQNIQRATSH